ncbi:hypothetical protein XELAEV_18010471mg [Xenopus laevis]|uniref:Uncharacterized protein n=1 Tax=Xenopus laevis TaxID=8355 RepID=A0A974I1U8_XENLA|nr:hypothetical protein XELAEV_18010471mg [Xenopus laevis]
MLLTHSYYVCIFTCVNMCDSFHAAFSAKGIVNMSFSLKLNIDPIRDHEDGNNKSHTKKSLFFGVCINDLLWQIKS